MMITRPYFGAVLWNFKSSSKSRYTKWLAFGSKLSVGHEFPTVSTRQKKNMQGSQLMNSARFLGPHFTILPSPFPVLPNIYPFRCNRDPGDFTFTMKIWMIVYDPAPSWCKQPFRCFRRVCNFRRIPLHYLYLSRSLARGREDEDNIVDTDNIWDWHLIVTYSSNVLHRSSMQAYYAF